MIPLQFHFIFGLQVDFGGKPFSFLHYMAVKSAVSVHPGAKAFLYYEHEPRGIYWEVAKRYLETVRIKAPREIFGRPLKHVAHQTDLLRLQILQEKGGIYLDLDTITTRGFASLLSHSCVMGRQGHGGPTDRGLCNAVILSEARHPFIAGWLEEFRHFRSGGADEFWDEHAVVVPQRLMDTGRYRVTVLEPEAFFIPSYDAFGIADMFIDEREFPHSHCHHLWESQAWHVAARINERNVSVLRNTYCRIARRHVGEDAAVFQRLREAEMRGAALDGLRVNLGCGVRRIEGWINIDHEPQTGPDMLFDIGQDSWPLEDDSVVEANASHVLEHLSTDSFRRFFQELYRVSRDGAVFHVRVPSPTHDRFWTDPEHVRPVLPDTIQMLNRDHCRSWMVLGDPKTPLAVYWNVDFVMDKCVVTLDAQFDAERERKAIPEEEFMKQARHQNNIIAEYVMDLVVRKPAAA